MIGKLKLLDLRNRRKKRMSLRDKCNTIEEMKIGIIGFPERRENAKEKKRPSEEVMVESFPNLMKDMNLHPRRSTNCK